MLVIVFCIWNCAVVSVYIRRSLREMASIPQFGNHYYTGIIYQSLLAAMRTFIDNKRPQPVTANELLYIEEENKFLFVSGITISSILCLTMNALYFHLNFLISLIINLVLVPIISILFMLYLRETYFLRMIYASNWYQKWSELHQTLFNMFDFECDT